MNVVLLLRQCLQSGLGLEFADAPEMARFVVFVLFVGFTASCARTEARREQTRHEEASHERPASPEARRKAPTTPEIVERAEKILAENEGAPIGTEIAFTLNGRRYVARVETHDNPDATPDRPLGQHRGFTVYVAD